MTFKNKILRFLFPLPSIVLLVSMGLLFAFSETSEGPMTLGYWFIYMTIVFLCFVLPLDFILHNQNQKAYKKEAQKRSEQLLNEATVLADIINTTTDDNVFFESYDKLINIFEELCLYEEYHFFKGQLPSQNLIEIKQKREVAILDLKERQEKHKSASHCKSTLLSIDNMEGHDFEYFCADLLRQNGFINVEVTQGSGDHGIDVLAEKDDITYAIQCKCYSSNIGNAAVQQAHTGKTLYHKDVAVVMTNRYFTAQAKEEATALGIKLWDRDKLNELIQKSML